MTKDELEAALAHPNVLAFLRAIRLGEGTSDEDGYYRIVGSRSGRQFEDFSDHPRKLVWVERIGNYSSAAGAYQFIRRTWDEVAKEYGLEDFSPHNQDLGAVGRIVFRGALDAVMAGDIREAVWKCRLEWASLPGAGYEKQRMEPLENVLAEYEKHGGTLA